MSLQEHKNSSSETQRTSHPNHSSHTSPLATNNPRIIDIMTVDTTVTTSWHARISTCSTLEIPWKRKTTPPLTAPSSVTVALLAHWQWVKHAPSGNFGNYVAWHRQSTVLPCHSISFASTPFKMALKIANFEIITNLLSCLIFVFSCL